MPFPDYPMGDPLQALKPAIAPPPVPWWPPAPGWWFVASALLVLIVLIIAFAWRRRRLFRATRYQREAIALLDQVLEKNDTRVQLQDIARILRRALISAYGRESAGTQPWAELAQRVAVGSSVYKRNSSNTSSLVLDEKNLELLGSALYQQHSPTPEEIQHLLKQVNAWLVKLPPHQSQLHQSQLRQSQLRQSQPHHSQSHQESRR